MQVRQRTKDGQLVKDVYDITVELPRDETSQRRRRKFVHLGSLASAVKRGRTLQAQADKGELSIATGTVGDMFDRFLAERVRPKRSPGTLQTYTAALTAHADTLRAVKLSAVAKHHISAFETRLTSGGKPLSPKTVSTYFTALRSAFDWAEEMDLVPASHNPVKRWEVAAAGSAERPSLTREEAGRYVAALAESPWRPHLLVFLSTGLRLSEVRGLRVQDVDLAARTYQVHQQLQRLGGKDVLRPVPKSKLGKRGGGLPPAVVVELRRWMDQQAFAKRKAGRAWADPTSGALLFASHEAKAAHRKGVIVRRKVTPGEPFNVDALRRHHYAILREAKLTLVHLHDLRHSFVTLALDAGVPDHVVPQLVGHTPKVDEAVYRHRTTQTGLDAADTFWRYISVPADTPEPDAHEGS